MILGHVQVDRENGAVNTHRDSYLLKSLTVVSVRRPFIEGGMLFGTGYAGFILAFGDLLFWYEIALTLVAAGTALFLGFRIGQLKLLSRDLRGSELSGVIWGSYAELNGIRRNIVLAIAPIKGGD